MEGDQPGADFSRFVESGRLETLLSILKYMNVVGAPICSGALTSCYVFCVQMVLEALLLVCACVSGRQRQKRVRCEPLFLPPPPDTRL